MGRATKQRGDQDGQRDGKRDDKNTSTRMTRTKAVVTLALLFLLASAAGTPTFAAEDVEVKTNDALAALAQQMISTEGVLENVAMNITGGVTNLTPLSGLKHIKNGNLTISGTSNLVSLAPLENLEVVDGDLYVEDNEALTKISLPSLTEVGGDLSIYDNAALTAISLPSLTEVGGSLEEFGNKRPTSLSLPNLGTVGNDFSVVGFSWKGAQTFLANFSAALVGGDFDVGVDVLNNEELAELAQQMISADGVLENVTMNTTGGVTDLTPLSGLKHIKNSGLYIQETSNLVSLAPLENLEVVDDRLWIMLNGALTDISLPSLTEVGFDLGILYNEALAIISLPSLTEVGMVLMIDDNDGRTSFDFPSLESGRIFLLPDSLRDWGYVAMDAEKAGGSPGLGRKLLGGSCPSSFLSCQPPQHLHPLHLLPHHYHHLPHRLLLHPYLLPCLYPYLFLCPCPSSCPCPFLSCQLPQH